MTIVAPADIAIYRSPLRVSCSEVPMPESPATVPLPPCLLCSRLSHHAPSAVGWITAGPPDGWAEKLFVICWACDGDGVRGDSDKELKAKIAARFQTTAPAVAAE
jgi:hypothetical protein